MASFDTLQKLNQHPDWLPPRSDIRVFIGEPGAPEAVKTTVEPGNVFSPGMLTFGVTWWLRLPETGEFFATETAPLDTLRWSYERGSQPTIHCDVNWKALAIRHSLFQDGNTQERNESVCGRLQLTNSSKQPQRVEVYIALRSLGPAGGPVEHLAVGNDGHSFWQPTRMLPFIAFDQLPGRIGCGVGDPSPLAYEGSIPPSWVAHDDQGWCFGLACWEMSLDAMQSWTLHVDCPIQSCGTLQQEIPSRAQPMPARFDERLHAHCEQWRSRFKMLELDVPDEAFQHAFFAGLQHMLTAMVGDQARIAPLSYPLPWLRDSIYIIRCLDQAGFHKEARAATEYCVRNDFFGGFGAEGDAPGQGIWAICQHYRITQDRDWLERAYPAIQRKCDWLFAMRRAAEPLQVFVDTPTLAFTHAERNAGVVCLAAQDGIIMGAMDHGISYSLGWVNHWAILGLREAAYAANLLGESVDADRYEAEAQELLQAYKSYCQKHPQVLQEERTVNSLVWPSQVWEPAEVRPSFMAWWNQARLPGGQFQPEPYWLYFEMAQAHNALLIGELDPVWQVLNYRLAHQDLPGLFGWREGGQGVGTENAVHGVTLIPMLRGCHRFESITPHGWSQAEMWLLQRAVLVEEWREGLLLFGGVPSQWLYPGAQITFTGFPTTVGTVNARLHISHDGTLATIHVDGVRDGTPVVLRLNGNEMLIKATKLGITTQIHLNAQSNPSRLVS
jgi:hypothetical protein